MKQELHGKRIYTSSKLFTFSLLVLTSFSLLSGLSSKAQCHTGGISYGNLLGYHMVFTNGSVDANWQGATKGFIGDVAVNGLTASLRTSGNVPYAGTIYTNDNTLGPWQAIVNQNTGQASASFNETTRLTGLSTDLENVFTQINALPVTSGYNGINPTSLDGLNTQNGIAETFVINVTSGFQVSSQINITGDANDVFIFRWDTDANFANGYNGQVKFQSGGAIVPHGGLTPANFFHVAGDINSSGGGSTPPAPYPQGPRTNNGTGSLINGGSDFGGGGFFTGYWFTTGAPTITVAGQQPYGETAPQSNAVFVGGWYTKTTKFSLTSGSSGVHITPTTCETPNLTPTIEYLPNISHGISSIGIVTSIYEIKNVPTTGLIQVYITKDPKYTITYSQASTVVGGRPVHNNVWTLDNSNPNFYIFSSTAVIPGDGNSNFGFNVTFNPNNSNGQTTISAFILPLSGGETAADAGDNHDDDILVYFFN